VIGVGERAHGDRQCPGVLLTEGRAHQGHANDACSSGSGRALQE
jgi:hypothetical protein